jgi:hypothetical protein
MRVNRSNFAGRRDQMQVQISRNAPMGGLEGSAVNEVIAPRRGSIPRRGASVGYWIEVSSSMKRPVGF